MPNRRARLEGGLVGLLVGDALGVPYEFHGPALIPPESEIDYTPPPGFARAHRGTPSGTWSDDGAQALCLLASLLDCGSFDPEVFATRLLRWLSDGYLAVDNRVFDCGITTGQALKALQAKCPALEAGLTHASANGNGALMRVLPLALWHRGSDAELVADARAQSRVTHGHPRSQLCCALYCLWARRILDSISKPWANAVLTLRTLVRADAADTQELEQQIQPDRPLGGAGSGYVVDCLHSARLAVAAGSYENTVKAAVRLGHDTDTTACVAGGIAGLRDGIDAIPNRWIAGLRGQDLYQPLLDGLLHRESS
jgi:ADP-ribosyl-[dinitrogen reductase] hydrolase